MAAAAGSLTELDCPICFDPYDLVTRTPRFLPCHHSLCHSCLHCLIDRRQTQGAVKCPLCQKIALVPVEKAFGFQVNFYLEHRLAAPNQSVSHGTVSPDGLARDTRREKTNSGSFDGTINEENNQSTLRKTVSVSDFYERRNPEKECSNCSRLRVQSASVTEDLGRLRIRPLTSPCAKHHREELLLYCRQCKLPICMLCKMTSHERHPSDDITDVASTIRQHMQGDVSKLETNHTNMQNRIQHLQDRKRDYICKVDVIREDVMTKRENIYQGLVNITDQALGRLGVLQTETVRVLDSEIDQLTVSGDKLKSTSTSLVDLLDTGTDVDIITRRMKTDKISALPINADSQEHVPVLLSHLDDLLHRTVRQSYRLVNIRSCPRLIKAHRTTSKLLGSAGKGVWCMTDTDVKRVILDGETGSRIPVTNIVDSARTLSGTIYLLLQMKDKWLVKTIELDSFLGDFLELPSTVDRITCCHDNSLVLASVKDGKLTLDYHSKDRKWLRCIQVPCRHAKVEGLVEMSIGKMAVLFHTSQWTSEIIILDCGGQILHKFSGNQRQGCNVTSMVSLGDALLVYDKECGDVLLLNFQCDILCEVIRKVDVGKWMSSYGEIHSGCHILQMVLDVEGVMWILCRHDNKFTLGAVHWQD